jgi:phosphoadenosine phosphosulfate reductase
MKQVLQFSGGKDSLALLYLMQPHWDDVLVLWCNPGNPHASTRALMDSISKEVPHFLEVRGNQPDFVRHVGYPSDIVPVSMTKVGRMVEGTVGVNFVSAYECCYANLWAPMNAAMQVLGAKVVYRGQKACDERKSPIRDGYIEHGITYRFPLEDWSDADVMAYLGDRVPEHYRNGEATSRDCVDCTAFLDENVERIRNLPQEQRLVLIGRLQALIEGVDNARETLALCLNLETAK